MSAYFPEVYKDIIAARSPNITSTNPLSLSTVKHWNKTKVLT